MGEPGAGDRIDQYDLEEEIARSGMATVFRARDRDDGRVVVLKIPHLQFASDIAFNERFHREEHIGQRLDHPAIIKVLTPREKSRLYLAMEHVDGEELRERMRREGPLPIATAVEFAIQIADALTYLHGHGVVHRDLKPENIMVTPDGRVKLMDFGIALDETLRKVTWSGLSQTFGTPDYMAPEQVKGKRGDARSDLYSLGAILYEMLTGRPPFGGPNVYAAMQAKLRERPPPPRRLRAEIPPALEEIVLNMLEREPHQRPESALEVREALAHPDSVVIRNRAAAERRLERLPPWARRSLMLLAAVLGYLILVGVLFRLG